LNKIIENIGDKPLAVICDLSSLDANIAPLSIRESFKTGINIDQLDIILKKLAEMNKKFNNVKMIDITGHYLSLADTNPAFRVTIETITKIYAKILNMKEYAINIYNENTRFLIFKPVDEICIERDSIENIENLENIEKIIDINEIGDNYGWYILRNIPKEYKEDLLKEIDDDTIKIINIGEDDTITEIMVSCTSVNEQNEKCYYTSTSYKDCTLYPDEKMAMVFELVN